MSDFQQDGTDQSIVTILKDHLKPLFDSAPIDLFDAAVLQLKQEVGRAPTTPNGKSI